MKKLPESLQTELDKACENLSSVLGNTTVITPEQLVRGFSGEQLSQLYEPGLTENKILEQLQTESAQTASLSSPKLAANALTAFWKWAKDGFSIADANQQERRLAACQRCEYYSDPPETVLYNTLKVGKMCRLCGCDLAKKIRLASSVCPAEDPENKGRSKWGE